MIASHSSARALCDHSRNMDDELLLALKKNGGVVQTVAFATYVKTPPPPTRGTPGGADQARGGIRPARRQPRTRRARWRRADVARRPGAAGAAAAAPRARRPARGAAQGRGRGRGGALAQLPDDKRAEAEKRLAEIDKQFPPPPRANVKDFVDHIDYIVKKIGIDHVGISSDFDGGGGIDGWNDASETFNVTLELVRRGYTEEQIGKIWSGNLLRVMEEVRQVASAEASQKGRRSARTQGVGGCRIVFGFVSHRESPRAVKSAQPRLLPWPRINLTMSASRTSTAPVSTTQNVRGDAKDAAAGVGTPARCRARLHAPARP